MSHKDQPARVDSRPFFKIKCTRPLMADTRTLTKRKFRIEEPNSYGANYVVRAIKYEPLFKNIRGEVIYEAGYYLDLSPQKLELRQDGLILSSGTYDVFRGIPGRELVFLMPASRFNAKTAEKVVEQYKDISYVQEYCDRHGLTLAASDPDDERVNDSGFNWEHRTGGIYRYHNMDVKEKEYSLNYRGQSIYGIKDRDIPRSMRANLSKGEGMPVGGMTLMRTQDRKPKTKAPAKKCASKCTKPMVKSIPKKPVAKKASPKRK